MSTHPESSIQPKEERIRAIAYALWEEEGCPHGRDMEHWLRATELVDAEAEEDPDWLQRTAADSSTDTATADEQPAESPKASKTSEADEKASLDALVRRMKEGRAA